MLRKFGSMVRNQWAGFLALFLVLTGGTAMAVDGSLPGQNTVGSADIINGEVAGDDLGASAVGSAKIDDGAVKNADLAPGASASNTIRDGSVKGIDVDEASLSGGEIPGTTARAYGYVAADGTITNDRNVVGNATSLVDEGGNFPPPTVGRYCIQLSDSIDADTAAIIPETDAGFDTGSAFEEKLAWAKGNSDFGDCDDNSVLVETGELDVNGPGTVLSNKNEPFFFVVP
jgi:hypothetical protein